MLAVDFLAFGEQLQPDRGRGQRQGHADHQGGLPGRMLDEERQHPEDHGAQQHLQPADAEDGPAHQLESRQRQLKADDEQHHHHADLACGQNRLRVRHHAQRVRPQQDARDQVAEHGAQPETLEHRHRDHRGQQEYQRKFQSAAVHAFFRTEAAIMWARRAIVRIMTR